MRIAVLGAGGPAGVNALRALNVAGHDLVALDGKKEHLVWCEEYAETCPIGDWLFGEKDGIDLYLAQPDKLVLWLADTKLPQFQPAKTTIQRCQDKFFAVNAWAQKEMRKGAYRITEPWPDHLKLAEDFYGRPFWLRAAAGAGARGAIKVEEVDQAFHWIRFWQSRGADIEWIAEEFFPGRDLAWSSVWYYGVLVTSFARERLEYLYPHLTPEGLTGTPTIARIIHDAHVNMAAIDAVTAIDPNPHGIFSVDLKEDKEGRPCPTEINCRGFTTFGLWSLVGSPCPNFLDYAVNLAVNGWPDEGLPTFDALPTGLTLYRHIDCTALFKP